MSYLLIGPQLNLYCRCQSDLSQINECKLLWSLLEDSAICLITFLNVLIGTFEFKQLLVSHTVVRVVAVFTQEVKYILWAVGVGSVMLLKTAADGNKIQFALEVRTVCEVRMLYFHWGNSETSVVDKMLWTNTDGESFAENKKSLNVCLLHFLEK